jgi:hypothetical protein
MFARLKRFRRLTTTGIMGHLTLICCILHAYIQRNNASITTSLRGPLGTALSCTTNLFLYPICITSERLTKSFDILSIIHHAQSPMSCVELW